MKCEIIGTEKIQSVVIKHKGCGLMSRQIKRFDKYPVDCGWNGEPIFRDVKVDPSYITGVLEIEVEDFTEVTDLILMLENFIYSGKKKIGRFKESENNV